MAYSGRFGHFQELGGGGERPGGAGKNTRRNPRRNGEGNFPAKSIQKKGTFLRYFRIIGKKSAFLERRSGRIVKILWIFSADDTDGPDSLKVSAGAIYAPGNKGLQKNARPVTKLGGANYLRA
jgi:hypothetical protein